MTEEFIDLIEKKDFKQLKSKLKEMLVPDIASFIENIEDISNKVLVFRLLPNDLSAEVFSYMSPESQESIVADLNDKELSFILEELATDDAVDFLEEMPAPIVERILKNATPETRKTINKFLSYKEDTAGAIMTPEFVRLDENLTVSKAFEEIRKQANEVETINVIYVTDKTKVLKGCLSIRDLMLADKKQKLSQIMEDNVIVANTSTDQEEIGLIFKKYDIIVLPIIDKEHRMVGIITVDDIMEVIESETTRDIQQMSGIVLSTDKPYMKVGVWETFVRCSPWLIVLMVSATFTGIIINTYESSLNALSPLLFACIPMLMDTGGNSGSQTSSMIIRGIALDEIKFSDTFKIVWKELKSSIIIGLALALACFAKLQLVDRLLFNYDYTVLMSLGVCLAMYATVIISKVVGCILPLFAKKAKFDPAIVSAPILTTIVDLVSLFAYCNISIALLS